MEKETECVTKIEVTLKSNIDHPEATDPTGKKIVSEMENPAAIQALRCVHVYYLTGISEADAVKAAEMLLSDPVEEAFTIDSDILPADADNIHVVEICKKAGVMEPVEASIRKGFRDLDISADQLRLSICYYFTGNPDSDSLMSVGRRVLANEAIEDIHVGRMASVFSQSHPAYVFAKQEITLSGLSDDELTALSRENQLSLNLEEMKTIRNYFNREGREPTDVELETLAQTWSEHCCHKTLTGRINFNGEIFDNLLKQTVFRVTRELDRPWCLSVFKDNAGVIDFDDENAICFKVETHNHPSAIEPYGGAGTGTGGVIRDIMGTGLGAKPVLNTDVFCFGEPETPAEDVPPGTLHPRRIITGVVSGVRDYGNRMGIPTANGSVFFDKRYIGNPLVYCGTVGIMPKSMVEKEARSGDCIIVAGGRTGRDGIHGATFSSIELDEQSETISSGAVQIGNPIQEKKLLDAQLRARDLGLYTCVTDCGAGGLSSAVGEMGQELGADVELSVVPLKYSGLSYTEIWISEAQERMVFAVPEDKKETLIEIFDQEDVEATEIGKFTDTGRLRLFYENTQVADLDMEFLHDGLPDLELQATWTPVPTDNPSVDTVDCQDALTKILSSLNVCSREWIIRQYDHEVQGTGVLKPLQGRDNDGPGDACVIAPVYGSKKGVIISNGMNPCYGDLDPYHMAASAIDEAIRQIIAVGGNMDRVALLDNYSWGSPSDPEKLGALVRASQGCYDTAKPYGLPFISGKDSLNNEYSFQGKTISIPHTLLISAISVMEDVSKAVTMDLKGEGSLFFVVGLTRREMGGSHLLRILGKEGGAVPQVYTDVGKKIMLALSQATDRQLVRSCHDCSEGGIAVAAAEMAFAGGTGLIMDYTKIPAEDSQMKPWEILFSESNSRFLVEVAIKDAPAFEDVMKDVSCACVGQTNPGGELVIHGPNNKPIIRESLSVLKKIWKKTLHLS